TATYVARFAQGSRALLVDMGTTTTDYVPIINGVPKTRGQTDYKRLQKKELLYLGWKRSPVSCILGYEDFTTEYFATTYDVCIALKMIVQNLRDNDTADGRPATIDYSLSRLAR